MNSLLTLRSSKIEWIEVFGYSSFLFSRILLPLGRFSEKESQIVDQVLEEVLTGLDMLREKGLERAGTFVTSCKAQSRDQL